jgi:hypothetical protein
MWVVGEDLVITSFPQRWQQPRNDAHNVLDGIIADIHSPTRHGIASVLELAVVIASHCCSCFGRHGLASDEMSFLDMFEASIGIDMEKEVREGGPTLPASYPNHGEMC